MYTYDIQNEEKSQPAVMTGKSHNLRFSATRHKMDMTPGGFFSSASVLKTTGKMFFYHRKNTDSDFDRINYQFGKQHSLIQHDKG